MREAGVVNLPTPGGGVNEDGPLPHESGPHPWHSGGRGRFQPWLSFLMMRSTRVMYWFALLINPWPYEL